MKKYFKLLFCALLSLFLLAGITACSDDDEKASSTNYSISFDNYLSMIPPDNPVIAGENAEITLPAPSYQGRGFEGWHDGAVRAGGAGDTYTVTKTVRLSARWAGLYTISFANITPAIDPVNAAANSTITLPNPSAQAGYIFDGWYDGVTKVGGASATYTVTKNVTLTAKWVDLYIINFDNVTTPITPVNAAAGSSITLPGSSKTHYTLEGWYDGTTRVGGASSSYTVTKTITLRAGWTPVDYTVGFDNVTTSIPSITGKYGEDITLPTPAPQSGLTFVGWFDGATSVGNAGASYIVEKNVTLSAGWTNKPTFTVTYDNATFETLSPATEQVTVPENEDTMLPTPSKAHNTFNGWYDLSTKVGNAGDNYTVTQNVTLAAAWTPITYTVNFDNVTTPITAEQGIFGTVITLATPGNLTGFTFDGWYDGENKAGDAGENYTIIKNVTLMARFTVSVDTVTITFKNCITNSSTIGNPNTTSCAGILTPGAICNATTISGDTCVLPRNTALIFAAYDSTIGADSMPPIDPPYPLPVPSVIFTGPTGGGMGFLYWSLSDFAPGDGYFECVSSGGCYSDPSIGLDDAPAIISDPTLGGTFIVDQDYIFHAVFGRGC